MSADQVTLGQLESHLWESANILRGPVDAADFKTYIFPLLFFKRICDVWDEEYQEIVDETGDEQLACFPESHRFQIPQDCHWNDVRAKAANIGAALHHAMRGIEQANPDVSVRPTHLPRMSNCKHHRVHVNHRAHHVSRDSPFALLCPPHAPGLQRAIQG